MDPSYNNLGGLGSGGAPTPIRSDTGDIIITPEKKKTRKKVIIVAIVAFLIISGLFAVMFLMPKGGADNDTKLAFYRYANYLLYGEDSDKALEGEYDYRRNYAVDELDLSDENEANNFFSKADELWDRFDASIGNMNGSIKDEANDYFGNYYLISLIYRLSDDFEKDLDLQLERSGETMAKEKITARYKTFVNSDYETVKNYGQKMIDYYNLYVDDAVAMTAAGCFTEMGCAAYDNAVISEQMENDLAEASEIENNAMIKTVENCWRLNDVLNGKTVESEDGE